MDFALASPRTPQLDGIRGIAILQVLTWHYAPLVQTAPGTPLAYAMKSLALSWSGVDLFFVLSGFLIGGALIDSRDQPRYFQVFYIRRAFRILPLYFVLLALGYTLAAVGANVNETGELVNPLWYVTFTQNIKMTIQGNWDLWLDQTWSLAVEEQFYLLLPFALVVTSAKWLPAGLIGVVIGALGVRIALWFTLAGDAQTATLATHTLFPARMDSLALGVLAAWAVRNAAVNSWLRAGPQYLYLSLLSLVLVCFAMGVTGTLLGTAIMQTFGLSVLALLYTALLLIAVTEREGFVSRLTQLSWLRRIGLWAYSLYLTHWLVLFYTFKAFGKPLRVSSFEELGLLVIALLAMLLLADLSWRFFESPFIALGHRWRHGAPQPRSSNQTI